jgi:hypothetical protein
MASTDDLLFSETDGACANCGIKDTRTLTIHHLDHSKPKNEDYDNKLVLCRNCHQCHHELDSPTADQLKQIKRRLIIKTLTRPGLNALKEAYRRTQVFAMPFLVNHLVEQQYLEYKERHSNWNPEGVGDGIDIMAIYTITDAGKQLLQKWDL